MANILITGATGNIGKTVIKFLSAGARCHKIVAGVRNISKAQTMFQNYPGLHFVTFDFEDPETFEAALNGIDMIFLLRPPHISQIDKYFRPLLDKISQAGIKQIMFLSVQGAEKSKVIPHNKIERLILELGLEYIFLRPSYFMQNLTTTLIDDIVRKRGILLPAANAKFNWVDIDNIGEVAAVLLDSFSQYKNQAYELTGLENMNFTSVVDTINKIITVPLVYHNINPVKFYRIKKQEGMESGMIVVMFLLHFLPRFQKEPSISDFYEQITGKRPTKLVDFIQRERLLFEKQQRFDRIQ